MKTTILSFALALSMTASAQQPDMNAAGIHLEKAGKARNTAMLVGILSAGIGGAALAMDKDNAQGATAMLVLGLGASVAINIGANRHERQAGRLLQAKKLH